MQGGEDVAVVRHRIVVGECVQDLDLRVANPVRHVDVCHRVRHALDDLGVAGEDSAPFQADPECVGADTLAGQLCISRVLQVGARPILRYPFRPAEQLVEWVVSPRVPVGVGIDGRRPTHLRLEGGGGHAPVETVRELKCCTGIGSCHRHSNVHGGSRCVGVKEPQEMEAVIRDFDLEGIGVRIGRTHHRRVGELTVPLVDRHAAVLRILGDDVAQRVTGRRDVAGDHTTRGLAVERWVVRDVRRTAKQFSPRECQQSRQRWQAGRRTCPRRSRGPLGHRGCHLTARGGRGCRRHQDGLLRRDPVR